MTQRTQDWHVANQQYLNARLRLLGHRLAGDDAAAEEESHSVEEAAAALPGPAALDRLAESFGLSAFESDLLLVVAGIELDAGFATRCAQLGAPGGSGIHFSFALARLPDSHWSALTPNAPLRRWRLIELSESGGRAQSVLHIDERVLHYLLGISYLDSRLEGVVRRVPLEEDLSVSQREVAARVASLVAEPSNSGAIPLIHLHGAESTSAKAIASAACGSIGLRLHMLRGADIPVSPADRITLARLWEREAALEGSALLVETGESDNEAAVDSFLEVTQALLLVAGPRGPRTDRQTLRCEFQPPDFAERELVWQKALGGAAARLNGGVRSIASQFRISAPAVRDVAAEAMRVASPLDARDLEQQIWLGCRRRSRRGLERLAQRIDPRAGWQQLVLPGEQMIALRSIVAHVRQQARVYEEWGFARQSARGLGVSALFAGPSGTGKTFAAEVIARELSLDLYRIDLSQVISKYIGETEKNLRAVFDAAEEGGAVLLFDEADALFGKRSEVKDSHDRYANIEVSYLLQRMEDYRGLAILTTNQKEALDKAFLRRLRFVVQFLFPDAGQRAEIWRRIFPPETPTAGLDPQRLAQMSITGGNIRNIALCGAFLAAEANEPVRMRHLMEAARAEYAKLDRPLTQSETGGGWT